MLPLILWTFSDLKNRNGLTLGRRILELRINLPDENFGRHSQVGKTAYTVVDKIQDSKNKKITETADFENI